MTSTTGANFDWSCALLLLGLLVATDNHEDEDAEHGEEQVGHDVDAAAGLRLGLGRNKSEHRNSSVLYLR